MMQHEKDGLLELLSSQERWCRDAEARDRRGQAVRFNDPAAVAWDLTGALCRLFGWARAAQLFPQLERHLTGSNRSHERPYLQLANEPQILSMIALQEYNDLSDNTYETMIDRLKAMAVYRAEAHHPSLRAPV